jgi:hypothetical protein
VNSEHLMYGLSVLHLRFVVRAREPIAFNDQPGSAIRGALYEALASHFCSERDGAVTPNHQDRCPVCWLLAAEDPLRTRGQDMPRALTIEPPTETRLMTGRTFSFGLSLVGRAQELLPYIIHAAEKMGHQGIGIGRGRFELREILEWSPLYDAERMLMNGREVQLPTLHVTPARVAEIAAAGRTDFTMLEFLTPLRLTSQGMLVKRAEPTVFVSRLLERCQALATHYAHTTQIPAANDWKSALNTLKQAAEHVHIGYDDTKWVEAFSGSRRQGRMTPISGLIGLVRWDGTVTPLREWLLWGQSLHVGKDAVKGNGWYRVLE